MELKLYQKLYDFLIWMFNKTDGFPKSKRFSVGRRIEEKLLDVVENVYRLQYTKKKAKLLYGISMQFDEIKLMVKICYDSKLLSLKGYAYASEQCKEIGMMIGGLRKACA